MRANGFNRGMGGSMHAFFPPFGAYPNNAIVGASGGIATGAALRKKLANEASIAVAMSGDGSTGCGPVFEAMNFAAMAQYDTLWTDARKGGLPVLFFFTNNFYAMGGQTVGETMGWDRLSRIGAAVNHKALHAETVDGTNPLAVADAVARKRALLLSGQGPALLDVECYRSTGHSTTDANVYRTKEEIAAWESLDPIHQMARQAGGRRHPRRGGRGVFARGGRASDRARHAGCDRSFGLPHRRHPRRSDPHRPPDVLRPGDSRCPTGEVKLLAAPETSARIRQDAKKSRTGIGPDGAKLSAMRAITLRDGLFEAILHHMIHDERLIAYGEECREWGGAFGVYRGLSDILPYERLFNSPISEAAIVATAVGHALEGGRTLVELMYGDFIGRAGDEIFNQMAKWHSMSGGVLKVPVVLRCSVGSKYGAQHSQDWTAIVAHMPGLKVLYPATPYDAKGLMASALSSEDPVVFFESQRLYDTVETLHAGGVPADYYRIPMGEPDVKREGRDVTVLTIGPSLYAGLAAADQLEQVHGLSLEVIDARSLVPFNYDPVLASVKKTGRLLVVSEASERGSFAMTHRRQCHALRLRRSQGAAARAGLAQLDRAGCGDGDHLLPAGRRHLRGCHRRDVPRKAQQPPRRPDLERPRPRPRRTLRKDTDMDTPIVMPQLGNEIEEAQIDGWTKAVGDSVTEGETLLTITTPKLTMEIPAPASGTLKEIRVAADDLAAVGATLGVIAA